MIDFWTLIAYGIAAAGVLGIALIEKYVHYKPKNPEAEKPMDGDWVHLCSLLL